MCFEHYMPLYISCQIDTPDRLYKGLLGRSVLDLFPDVVDMVHHDTAYKYSILDYSGTHLLMR